MTEIDAATVRALPTGADVLLLDVRTPGEFETAHLEHAVNVPLDRLDSHLPRLTAAAKRIIVICQSGNRAATAHTALTAAGITGAAVLVGGMNAWTASGAPVIRGRQRWSLERQVRLAAGLLVLATVALSLLTPWALLATAFVGAGLTFAGATDTCMMGLLLARLPYNQGGAADPGAEPARACRR